MAVSYGKHAHVGENKMENKPTATDVNQLEIHSVSEDLNERIEQLHGIIAHLESRLSPVCRSEPEGEGQNESVRSANTMLGSFICTQTNKVDHANNRLSRILRLLEL